MHCKTTGYAVEDVSADADVDVALDQQDLDTNGKRVTYKLG